jgi:AcrR family transcriptional regulator
VTTTALSHRERLLLAGDSLMIEYGSFDFGVREVVERAGVSLRTFYQYFETRDDFSLAIYAAVIERLVEALQRDMPGGARSTRFRYFVRGLMCPGQWPLMPTHHNQAIQGSWAAVREGFHLREARPEGYELAIAPLHGLLLDLLRSNDGNAQDRDATVVLNSLITETYSVLIEGSDGVAAADHLYRYHKRALGI